MKDTVLKIIKRFFPELDAKNHLPKFAVVTAVPDAPEAGSLSDQYRPRYAVDCQLLDEHYRPDTAVPEFKAVPVSLPFAGQERGLMGLPEPGAIVEIAFAYGLTTKPFIRAALPFRLSLEACGSNELVWQSKPGISQRCDNDGNWKRETDSEISDRSTSHSIETGQLNIECLKETRRILAGSTEEINGAKRIECARFAVFSSGSSTNGAGANNNVVAGSDINLAAGGKIQSVSGSDITLKATADTSLTAQKFWIGSQTVNVLQLLFDFMGSTAAALSTLASHTHPDVGQIDQGGAVSGNATEITGQQTTLNTIKKGALE